jgi:hypothetical protein
MRLGMGRRGVMEAAHAEQVDHKHVPGKAYDITDPALKLVHIVGGGLFNEPRYYDNGRNYAKFAEEFRTKGTITTQTLDDNGLNEQARDIIKTATDVANSEHPEDLLVIANWARNPKDGLKLRTTPQILLAIAAAHNRTKPYVRKYSPHIIKRADEIPQVFAAFRHLFQSDTGTGLHKGSVPHSLRKGLAESFARFKEYDLLKYNSEGTSFKDVLQMIGGSRKVPNAVSKPVYNYLVKGIKPPAKESKMIHAREELNQLTATDAGQVTTDTLREAGATWENVVSKFGSSKETWEKVIPLMGEFALVRNLRNFEQYGIDPDSWKLVYDKIVSAAPKTKLLPFRYYMAYKEVVTTTAQSALGTALEHSIKNLADLPGTTFAVADNSGSAIHAPISEKSQVKVTDCGNMLLAVLAKKLGRRATIGVFGDCYKEVPFSEVDSCMSIKTLVDHYGIHYDKRKSDSGYTGLPQMLIDNRTGPGVGAATETGLWYAIQSLIEKKTKVDRIILLSDLCCYTLGNVNCGIDMSSKFGTNATIQGLLDKYKRHINPDVKVYSVNLAGYAQSQTRPTDATNTLISGWSENIINMINTCEAIKENIPVEVPTVEALRLQFQVA